LSNATNPAGNVFNSTITNNGAFVTSRTPSYQNNLGYDADLFRMTNVLGNAQTSTQVRLLTNGDAYQPGVAEQQRPGCRGRVDVQRRASRRDGVRPGEHQHQRSGRE
jgi:hypothetical protein